MSLRFWISCVLGLGGLAAATGACAHPPMSASPPEPTSVPTARASPPVLSPPKLAFPNEGRKQALLDALPLVSAAAEERFKNANAVGGAVALVIDGEIVWQWAYGSADLEAQRPVTLATRFRIASVTKTFTALLLAKLRDEGALSFDDPLERFLPEAAEAPRFAGARTASLRDYLLHQSGFPTTGDYDEVPGSPAPSEEDLLRSVRTLAPVAAPGTSYVYSNTGYAFLGLAAARVKKTPYEALLKQAITEPMGLRSAAFSLAEIPVAERAASYAKEANGWRRLSETPLGAASPSGGLYMSIRDLAQWAAFHAEAYPLIETSARESPDRPREPVSRQAVRDLLALHVDPRTPGTTPLVHHALGWDGKVGLAPKDATSDAKPHSGCGGRVYWKAGGLEEFATLVTLLPEHGVAIVSVANSRAPLWGTHAAIADVLAKTGAMSTRRPSASPETERAADALLGLLVSFDPSVYEGLFGAYYRSVISADKARSFLETLKKDHGLCKRGAAIRVPHTRGATFELACEKDTMTLALELDAPGTKLTFTSWKTAPAPGPADAACEPVWR